MRTWIMSPILLSVEVGSEIYWQKLISHWTGQRVIFDGGVRPSIRPVYGHTNTKGGIWWGSSMCLSMLCTCVSTTVPVSGAYYGTPKLGVVTGPTGLGGWLTHPSFSRPQSKVPRVLNAYDKTHRARGVSWTVCGDIKYRRTPFVCELLADRYRRGKGGGLFAFFFFYQNTIFLKSVSLSFAGGCTRGYY